MHFGAPGNCHLMQLLCLQEQSIPRIQHSVSKIGQQPEMKFAVKFNRSGSEINQIIFTKENACVPFSRHLDCFLDRHSVCQFSWFFVSPSSYSISKGSLVKQSEVITEDHWNHWNHSSLVLRETRTHDVVRELSDDVIDSAGLRHIIASGSRSSRLPVFLDVWVC